MTQLTQSQRHPEEEMITSVLDLVRADRTYILDSMKNPPFLSKHWQL